jgi:hypothetical protein
LAVGDYLLARLARKVQEHRLGFQLVSSTGATPSTLRVFLSGLEFFYRTMQLHGAYPHGNPLVDSAASVVTSVRAVLDRLGAGNGGGSGRGDADERDDTAYTGDSDRLDDDGFPRMPARSGVAEPRPKHRLSDSYFVLVGHE